ncbi:MAG: VWA domain-containing protein [Dehalococcoidia bacterium]|nr:VWA domain-containing protein [Dehalococcoidia bacterium]MDW8119547.1 VWA domain-containing protein [Chloroflexota bacterium]
MPTFYRYARWDGTQQVFAPDLEQVLDKLAKDYLDHGDLSRALTDLLRLGIGDPQGQRLEGLRDLLERLRRLRQERLQRYNLDSILEDLRTRLDHILQTERHAIDQRVDEVTRKADQQKDDPLAQRMRDMVLARAQKSREFLDNLPKSLAGAIQQLSSYEFFSPEAQREFQELLEMLRGRVLDNFVQGLRQALQGMTPEQWRQIREMLQALNQMLRQRAQGQEPDFQGFMRRFGHFFGPNPPRSLDELLERLARQMAMARSLLESLSPAQRQELDDLLRSVLDEATMRDLAELAAYLNALFPVDEWGHRFSFSGDESLDLDQAMEMMRTLHAMDELEEHIQQAMRTGDLDRIDLDQVEEVLGPHARRIVEEMHRILRQLAEEGYLQHRGKRLELTPKGMRRIGQKALKEVFLHLKKDRPGGHHVVCKGTGPDLSGSTRPYQFGDGLDIDLGKSILNALRRTGPTLPVRFRVEDFEVNEREHLTQAATCLLLDQSRSMGLFGSFQAAKKVALALSTLIRTQYPRDVLYIIGFSDYAMQIKPEDLPQITWNAWVSGTNLHHALMLSRKLFTRHKSATRQIVVITDGEPTAHIEEGQAWFSYPPSWRTIQETLKEVRRCTQEGIIINTFMLESNYHLVHFVERMTRINRGRAFYTTPDRLGQYVLVDYVVNRRKRVVR